VSSLAFIDVPCALCGEDVPIAQVLSTVSGGYPDLDLRPPPLMDGLVHHIIGCCPRCAYCSTEPDKASPVAREVVATREYQVMSRTRKYPKKANHWRCASLIAEREGDWPVAASRMLYAAWICDDLGERWEEAARRCREKAIQLLTMAHLLGQPLFEEDPKQPPVAERETAVAADLLRRTGRLRECRLLVEAHLPSITNDTIRTALERQLELIEAGDTARHAIREFSLEDWY